VPKVVLKGRALPVRTLRITSKLSCLLALALEFAAPSASATVVERVVAVIGDRAILMSDLRARAEPFLVQVHQSVPAGAQQAAAISQVYKAVLEKIVDEELEGRAAVQAKISISSKEVDEAIARVAAQNQISTEKLLAEAAHSGINEQQYRDELRRQLLQAKLVNVRLQGRIRVTDEDLKAGYRKLLLEERQRLAFRASWITIHTPSDASAETFAKKREFAEGLTRAARTEDFGALARRYSDDAPTREAGGILTATKLAELPPILARAAQSLEPGESSPVLRVGDDFVILHVISRDASQLPAFDEARRELAERTYMDKMGQARRNWLDGLRRQNHVELRL
jgi:peptidyl-prolyl cis-trans isomerase SurA